MMKDEYHILKLESITQKGQQPGKLQNISARLMMISCHRGLGSAP